MTKQFKLPSVCFKIHCDIFLLDLLRNVAMGTSTAWARVSGFASAYAPLLVSCSTVSFAQ